MHEDRPYTSLLMRHLDATSQMLVKIIEFCPDELWLRLSEGPPIWHQVYHAVHGMDFWLRHDHGVAEFQSMVFEGDISPDLRDRSDAHLSKEELSKYIAQTTENKVEVFFDNMDDDILLQTLGPDHSGTYFDAILGQIRHVQYHVAECNTRLGDYNAEVVEWLDP